MALYLGAKTDWGPWAAGDTEIRSHDIRAEDKVFQHKGSPLSALRRELPTATSAQPVRSGIKTLPGSGGCFPVVSFKVLFFKVLRSCS